MDYKEMMNSPLLWAVCAFALSTVIIQAVIFTRKALKVGKEMILEKCKKIFYK